MNLLLEIGTEEIPAHAMPGILRDLKGKATKGFNDLRLDFTEIKTIGTPRRLALIAVNLAEKQKDTATKSKGPSAKIAYDAEGNLTKAALGFAKSKKVAPENLTVEDGYVYAVTEEKGEDAATLLPKFLEDLVGALSFPNSMRWADYSFRFIRPLRWLVALFGDKVIPFEIAGVKSGNVSRGHRFLSEGDFVVASADDYESACEKNFVIVDQDKRKELIRRQINEVAAANNGAAEIDENLLEEVIYLVEYPTALCGKFDEKYLSLPSAAVITPMRDHQRYFPVKAADGSLLPLFITVRNGGADFIDTVRHGNERVLKARLDDAEFFFNEDRKKTLEEHREKLKTVVYQEGLGTVYEKTERLQKLTEYIAESVSVDDENKTAALRAAILSKADLVTGMVTEFTELQGVMGKEYALWDGESRLVAEAIDEHYRPRSAQDSQAQTAAGRILSIADKIDAIVGTFSRGKIPTGSQDPFGLRRAALGLVKTLIEAKWHVILGDIVNCSMDLYGITDATARGKMQYDVAEFIRLRMKNILETENIRYDVAEAALFNVDDPFDVFERAKAVNKFVAKNDANSVLQAFVRVGNIADKGENMPVDSDLFSEDEEEILYDVYLSQHIMKAADYDETLDNLSLLAEPIEKYFDKVMVMDDNLTVRCNRLAMMKAIDNLLRSVADFEKIVL